MKQTKRKFKLFVNLDKEAAWLSDMARQGWRLRSAFFTYRFVRAEPEDAVIRIDFRQFKRKSDHEDYAAMFRDSGWALLYGSKESGNQYFIRTRPDSPEDIFSDTASKAARYQRLSWYWLCWFLLMLVTCITNWSTMGVTRFWNFKEFFFTPGLWELQGAEFWRSFLFELPFAFLRGGWPYLMLLGLALYDLFVGRAWCLFRRAAKEQQKKGK
ncbi:MAG: DUF2812 domain-containing protein [Clostridiales bacterium]|nr:DUF2812 domain-containing protein [Clostridiales bacterium]